VVICSGKIYFDLVDAREKTKNDKVVFIRLEQIYPFPVKSLGKELKRYAKNADIYWCQEEPKNMGAWNTVNHYINRTLEIINFTKKNVEYIGRKPSASTATGNLNKHLAQQKEILEKVVGKIN
jgi:2-oxoglutarate dehydrogenase E1 component